MTSIPDVRLNNGQSIPQFGFGVFQIKPAETAEATLPRSRPATGTSTPREMYGNEREVGEAVAKSGIDRADVFVTSKLNNGFHRPTTRGARSTTRSTRSASTTSTCS